MAITDELRHRMIEQAVRSLPHAHADGSVLLWQSLAAELRAIIGDRGFESLYARSLYRAGAAYPWLDPHLPQPAATAFRLLAARLHSRAPADAQAASAALLIIFTDTLILLIGDLLTNTILRTAWGDDVVGGAGPELQP
jgi:hypothetical protein